MREEIRGDELEEKGGLEERGENLENLNKLQVLRCRILSDGPSGPLIECSFKKICSCRVVFPARLRLSYCDGHGALCLRG